MSTDLPDFDVIVVGFGAAGACAAIAAAESGAKVLIVDRTLGGGASALSGGIVYAGGGTPYQVAAGYHDTPENMMAYLRQEVEGVVDDETLLRFCEESVDRLAWLESHGAQFDSSLCEYKTSYPTDRHYLYFSGNEKAHPYAEHAVPAPRGHRQLAKGMSSGKVLWQQLRDAVHRLGITVMLTTRVDDLHITDGQVSGICCRSWQDGDRGAYAMYTRSLPFGSKLTNWLPPAGGAVTEIADRVWRRHAHERTITAPNVILTAGGFVFNRNMVRRFAPAYVGVRPLGTTGDDGSGIRLGMQAGGTTAHLDRVTAWRFLSPPSALMEGVTVGIDGARVANEDLYGATHSEVIVREFGGRAYLIADSDTWTRARAQLREQTQSFQFLQVASMMAFGHRKADTLEALANKLDISPTGVLTTVAAYNAAIAAGTEDPAHKSAELCRPLVNGPFYGVDLSIRPSLTSPVPGLTLGGLRVEGSTGLVLDHNDAPIAGLYAAGRSAVGICSRSYVSGLALADCVFSGKRAGTHAATRSIPAAGAAVAVDVRN